MFPSRIPLHFRLQSTSQADASQSSVCILRFSRSGPPTATDGSDLLALQMFGQDSLSVSDFQAKLTPHAVTTRSVRPSSPPIRPKLLGLAFPALYFTPAVCRLRLTCPFAMSLPFCRSGAISASPPPLNATSTTSPTEPQASHPPLRPSADIMSLLVRLSPSTFICLSHYLSRSTYDHEFLSLIFLLLSGPCL